MLTKVRQCSDYKGYLVRMYGKVHFEKIKSSFEYLGTQYFGDIVCSNENNGSYWFVYAVDNVNPFGGDIEFVIVNGVLQPVHEFLDNKLLVLIIQQEIEKTLKRDMLLAHYSLSELPQL